MITKIPLSASSGGTGVRLVATSSAGTIVHATGTSSTTIDEVWMWATNTDTVDRKLTIEFGGTTSPDHHIEITIPAESGLVQVMPGIPLTGTGVATREIKAFAAAGNVIMLYGFVHRIS